MRVLTVHNEYQRPGGEDVVFRAEAALLEQHGHEVVRFAASNHDVPHYSAPSLAAITVWNRASMREVRNLIRRRRPDVMHVHNTFPLISPSIYTAAQLEGIPVVQTLHNYRLICPDAVLYRDGAVCNDCVRTRTKWPGVVHGCYRGSRAATGVVAGMLVTHSLRGTFKRRVDRYIVLSEFARRKFLEAGAIGTRIDVKPNFVDQDPGIGDHSGGYVLFVGRLSPEKGVHTLLAAASKVDVAGFHLKIAGSAPAETPRSGDPRIEWLGWQSPARIIALMKGASVLVFPSEWYEGCPMTVMEAFATGLPVIAGRLGTMAELVKDGATGLHFSPGDADDLATRIAWTLRHSDEVRQIGRRSREEYERTYTAERNYHLLMRIYQAALNPPSHEKPS